jgi:hypothetical protein
MFTSVRWALRLQRSGKEINSSGLCPACGQSLFIQKFIVIKTKLNRPARQIVNKTRKSRLSLRPAPTQEAGILTEIKKWLLEFSWYLVEDIFTFYFSLFPLPGNDDMNDCY